MIKYFLFATSIILADRLTKLWALTYAHATVFNRGISWSLLQSESPFNFALVTLLVISVIALVVYYTYQQYRHHQPIWAEVAVLAGACSNVFDRFWYGGVVDFILLEYGQFSWPLFNVADIVIVFGIMIMMYNSFWPRKKNL